MNKAQHCIQTAQAASAITSHVPERLTFPALILVTVLNSVQSLLELSVLIKTHAGVKYLVWSQFLSPDITLLRLLQHMGPLTP